MEVMFWIFIDVVVTTGVFATIIYEHSKRVHQEDHQDQRLLDASLEETPRSREERYLSFIRYEYPGLRVGYFEHKHRQDKPYKVEHYVYRVRVEETQRRGLESTVLVTRVQTLRADGDEEPYYETGQSYQFDASASWLVWLGPADGELTPLNFDSKKEDALAQAMRELEAELNQNQKEKA